MWHLSHLLQEKESNLHITYTREVSVYISGNMYLVTNKVTFYIHVCSLHTYISVTYYISFYIYILYFKLCMYYWILFVLCEYRNEDFTHTHSSYKSIITDFFDKCVFFLYSLWMFCRNNMHHQRIIINSRFLFWLFNIFYTISCLDKYIINCY